MEDNARARVILQRRAAEEHVALPPLLRTPRTWRWPLGSPQGEPDVYPANPHRYARKLVGSMFGVLTLGSLVAGLNYALSVSVPWALGKVLDTGLEHGLTREIWTRLVVLGLVILGVAVTQMAGQLTEIAVQMTAVATPARVAGRKLALDGRAVNRELESGDVVTSMLTDVDRIGRAALWFPEMVGAILSTVMILVIMFRTSPPLAWMVLIGLPIVSLLIGLLSKPLQRRQTENRDEQGKLTEISADAVAGLRVLRGIGGEDVFGSHYQKQSARVRDAGIRVALPAALLGVLRSVIPMLFTALVVGIGAILYFHNELSVGSLVAFFGFSQFLRNPIVVATRSLEEFTRAWVGVRKLARIQGVASLVSEDLVDVSGDTSPQTASSPAQWQEKDFALSYLTDTVSEVTVKPGLITGLVCANPDTSAATARRLARQEDSAQPTLLIDGTDVRTFPLDLVRSAILLSDTDPQLFAGTLRDQVRGVNSPLPREKGVRELVWRDVIENATRQEDSLIFPEDDEHDSRWLAALHVADADDVVESVNGGLDGAVAEKGRTLSGGQRQRVALARAVTADPAVLVTIEPTSAVDSHTESRVAQRLAQARHGKTTVIVSVSVLVLEHCDEVIVLDEAGREIVRGSHRELRERARSGDPAVASYLAIINRSVLSGGEPS